MPASRLNCLTLVITLFTTAHVNATPKPDTAQAEITPAPVATPPPNAKGQTPAFPEQTRAPEAVSQVAFKQTVVTNKLNTPWALQFLPDGRLLVTERPGSLRIVTQEGDISAPIKGVPQVMAKRQGGLLDVTLSPNFSKDRLVYLSFSEPRGGDKNGTSVARGRLSDDDTELQNVDIIFRQQPAWDSKLHFGSRLVWSPQGHLYVTLGERSHSEPRQLSQDTSTHLGKVIRINADGSVPADNPFVKGGGLPEIWSYGHRNVQGAAIDPATGELWTMEHGPRGGDELNLPKPGKNYGWPVITYGVEYSGDPVGKGITTKEGMEQPVYYFDPVIAPGGMTFYTGELFPQWQGSLFIGSLNPGALVRLELKNHKVVGEERLLTDVGRVRDVAQGPEGGLWLVTDATSGKLIHIGK